MHSLWLERAKPIPTDPFVDGESFEVVVVGAGITGLTTALLLARAGKKVAVVEARHVGAVATGHTTAKLSLLQGARLSRLLELHGLDVARRYVEANRAAQEWLLGFCEESSVSVERRDAFSYAAEPSSARRVNEELRACQAVGLEVERIETLELPFLTYGAVRLADQAQFDPLEVLAALAEAVRRAGGRIFEEAPIQKIRRGKGGWELLGPGGSSFAGEVVLTTGFPTPDRGGFFARLEAHRSYALAARVPGELPRGMYLSLDRPVRSLRTARDDAGELLIVGGNDHVVGRHDSTAALLEDLLRWTRAQFGDATLVKAWSAQDYRTLDELPYFGPVAARRAGLFTATGYDKWGMTNGVAGALALSGAILGAPPAWARSFARRGTSLTSVSSAVKRNGAVFFEMARGWASCLTGPGARRSPGEGEAWVTMSGLCPVGISRVRGEIHRVSAVCPHMGGILRWNDAEKSWDCPLHGSRFSHEGRRLEGPALRGLRSAHIGWSLPSSSEPALAPPGEGARGGEGEGGRS